MNRLHITTALFAAVVGFVAVAPKAAADEWDKKTIITTTEPLEVPGITLEPGTYVFKLADSSSDRHIVVIQNERMDKTYATILAIPNYRLQPKGKTTLMFWETPAGQPKALRAWFYPGDNFGQEFAYKSERATQITRVTHEEVPQEPVAQAAVILAPAPAPAPVRVEVAQIDTTPAPQFVAAAPTPEPTVIAQVTTQRELPQTGSNMPLLALFGFGAIGLALVTGRFAKRVN